MATDLPGLTRTTRSAVMGRLKRKGLVELVAGAPGSRSFCWALTRDGDRVARALAAWSESA